MVPLTPADLRRLVAACWESVFEHVARKPRYLAVPRPEQQLQFELAHRLRAEIRQHCQAPTWDRMSYDPLAEGGAPWGDLEVARAPVALDVRQLLGSQPLNTRSPRWESAVVAVHVLRSAPELIDFDSEGLPRHQRWLPTGLREQGRALERRVSDFESLSEATTEAFLFVVYANFGKRTTAVERREVASWASWQKPSESLWWASRYFRARSGTPTGAVCR